MFVPHFDYFQTILIWFVREREGAEIGQAKPVAALQKYSKKFARRRPICCGLSCFKILVYDKAVFVETVYFKCKRKVTIQSKQIVFHALHKQIWLAFRS